MLNDDYIPVDEETAKDMFARGWNIVIVQYPNTIYESYTWMYCGYDTDASRLEEAINQARRYHGQTLKFYAEFC